MRDDHDNYLALANAIARLKPVRIPQPRPPKLSKEELRIRHAQAQARYRKSKQLERKQPH